VKPSSENAAERRRREHVQLLVGREERLAPLDVARVERLHRLVHPAAA
jgi:hypothetical protein